MLLALCAILSALSFLSLLGAAVIPVSTLAFLTISSVCIGVTQLEGGVKYSGLSYCCVSALAFFVLPDKLTALYFIGFFGYYPIMKFYLEQLNRLWMEWTVKCIFFAVMSFIAVYLINALFTFEIFSYLPVPVVAAAGVVVLAVYDYALSLLFDFYEKRVRKIIRKK